MPPAPLPPEEAARLESLRSYAILDTACEEAFDDIAALAARLTASPIALVSLVDAQRQWFKAHHGLDVVETPRDASFCAHAILTPDRPLAVPDARRDPRFADNPLVTGAPGIGAYLGVPLVNAEGQALGTLCVIDRTARAIDEEMVRTLKSLARTVVATLELRRAMRRAETQALTDGLTGLPNRRAAMASLAAAIATGRPVAVIAVDLDHLKEANDAEGHAAGDALLRAVAERLRLVVRAEDVVARMGGDEFAAILIGVADTARALEVAERMREALHRPVLHGGRALRLGATLGVAMAPLDADGPEAVMRAADEAMVRAKRDARGGIGRASRADNDRVARAAAILRAFEADDATEGTPGVATHLQPILALRRPGPGGAANGWAVQSVEALARWHHPVLGPALGEVPARDVLEAIGPARAARLGRSVRRKALAAVAALRAGVAPGLRVALNLSASEVVRPDVILLVEQQAEEAGLPVSALEVEITEEALLDRVSDRALDQLAGLRRRGARLVLDDFGTGNAGLAQLLRLPLDAVKLDRRFVQRLGADLRAEEIVRATISLAHGLGLEMVAEGVETAEQAAALRALGCDAVQGFLFAKPMTAEALRDWLTASGAVVAPGE